MIDVWCSVVAFHTPPEEIERLVLTLSRATSSVVLTVVDNASTLSAIDAPAGMRVEMIRPGKNLGYGRAHNLAIDRSRGKCRYHLVMNSDIVFAPTVIDELVRFMDGRPSAGLAMPMVRYPDGRLQHLCRLLPDPAVLIGRRFFGNTKWAQKRNSAYELHTWQYDRVAEFPFLSGCFMFMRESVLTVAKGFDPRFFLYAEDLDLSRRIHAVSETLFYPYVYITHEYRSLKRRSAQQWRYALHSLAQYFFKWGWLNDPDRDLINARTVRLLEQGASMSDKAITDLKNDRFLN